MFLDLINFIIKDNSVIEKNNLLNMLNRDLIFYQLEKSLNQDINHEMRFSEFIELINNLLEDDLSNLDSFINESLIFDEINSKDHEQKIANIIIMLALVFRRYSVIDTKIKDFAFSDKKSGFYSLFIKDIFKFIENHGEITIYGFLEYICDLIIRRHLFEATLRLYDSNTKNWLFTEDNGLLYSVGKKIPLSTRDNRWNSIKSLLSDLNFIKETEEIIVPTQKGISWLKKIE